jgi:hypothetical protein
MASFGPNIVLARPPDALAWVQRIQNDCYRRRHLGPPLSRRVPPMPSMGPAQSELFPPIASLGPNIFFGGHPRYSSMGPEHSELFPPMASFGPNIVSACSPDALV